MKILAAIVIPPHLGVSGAVNAGVGLSRALAEFCSVDIALMADSDSVEQVGQARLLRRRAHNPLSFTRTFLPDRVRTLLYRSTIPDLVAKGGYDLVHIHNPIPTLEMRRIAAACVDRGVPYVVSTHGFVEVTSGGQAFAVKPYELLAWRLLVEQPLRFVVANATMMFATSPADVAILQGMHVPEQKIALVTNGVDPFFCEPPSDAEIAAVCKRFSLPTVKNESTPVCFFLGNHTNNKGLSVLVEAFAQTDRPYLLIVGGKQRPAIPYATYTARCRPGQRMIFTDSLSNAEARALFNYADLFVFPSLADTLPLVVLEAMASGLPVLSTTVGGIPFQVDTTCGCLVPPGDPVALRVAFETMTANPALLHKMGEAAIRRVREKFDWRQSANVAFRNYQAMIVAGQR